MTPGKEKETIMTVTEIKDQILSLLKSEDGELRKSDTALALIVNESDSDKVVSALESLEEEGKIIWERDVGMYNQIRIA